MTEMKCFSRLLLPLISILWLAETARADDGVPALLHFAEQYQSKTFSDDMNRGSGEPVGVKGKNPRSADFSRDTTNSHVLQQALLANKKQLASYQTTIHQQRKKLDSLNKALNDAQEQLRYHKKTERTPTINPGDVAPLMQLMTRFRYALGGTPDEKRTAALLKEAREETAQLKIAMSNNQELVHTLKQRLNAQENQAAIIRDEERDIHIKIVSDLKTKLAELQDDENEKNIRMAKLEDERHSLQEEIKHLRQRADYLITPEVMKSPEMRQTYAAGTALGQDILDMLDERKGWGVNANRKDILAGIIDSFTGKYQLTTDELMAALTESEKVVNKAIKNSVDVQIKKDESFFANFKKQKGAKQSQSGFWYRIGHIGDNLVADNAIVDVVVKESLTDGTVIQDMDLSGKVLSQQIDAYPPLFREAIGYLRNHGSITLVVPPELAYGAAGYLPKIPPNATMVYEMRIKDVKTPDEKIANKEKQDRLIKEHR